MARETERDLPIALGGVRWSLKSSGGSKENKSNMTYQWIKTPPPSASASLMNWTTLGKCSIRFSSSTSSTWTLQ